MPARRKSQLGRLTRNARRKHLQRKLEYALAAAESTSTAFTDSRTANEGAAFLPTFTNLNYSAGQQVICEISKVWTDLSNTMLNEDEAPLNPLSGHDEPPAYSSKPQRRRNDSVEEVMPDDPFADIKTEEMTVEPSIEFDDIEIKKEEECFEDEGNTYDDSTPFNDFQYDARDLNLEGMEQRAAQTEQEASAHLYLEDLQNATYEEVNENDLNNITGMPVEPTFACPVKYCNNIFINEGRLRIHLSREHNWYRGSFKYNCSKCVMSYERKNSLVAHVKRKHGPQATEEDKTELTCDICFNILIGQRRMRFHMQRRHQVFTDAFMYKCRKCPFSYDKEQSLIVHMRRKHSNRSNKQYNFVCPICTKLFTNRQSYMAHLKRKHRQKVPSIDEAQVKYATGVEYGQFRCPKCSMLFTGIDRLRLHMRRKHNALQGLFQYRCPQCRLSYDKRESMQRHMQRKHNKEFYCTTCKNQFPTQKQYENHSHDGPSTKRVKDGIHQCGMCKMIYLRPGSLRNHIRLCHSIKSDESEPVSLYCEKCGEGFDSQHHLVTHTRSAHTDASYRCAVCNKSFHLKGSLATHISRKHKGEKTESQDPVKKEDLETSGNEQEDVKTSDETLDRDDYGDSLCMELDMDDEDYSKDTQVKTEEQEKQVLKCTECEAVFDSWAKVRNHLKKVHIVRDSTGEAVPSKDVVCQHCGLVCTETQLNKHMRAEHKDKFNIYKCGQCNYTTFKRDLLFKHEANHNREKNCVCTHDGCTYRTHNKYHFQKHMAIHSGKSKQKCPLCPYESNDTNLMRNHKYEHDTGKKRYQCDKCDYATNIPASIVHHRFKHSDERNFKCNLCKFSSKYSTSLWLHKKQKHSDKSPLQLKCDITKRPDADSGTETAGDSVENKETDIKIKENPVV